MQPSQTRWGDITRIDPRPHDDAGSRRGYDPETAMSIVKLDPWLPARQMVPANPAAPGKGGAALSTQPLRLRISGRVSLGAMSSQRIRASLAFIRSIGPFHDL